MLPLMNDLQDTVFCWLPKMRRSGFLIYYLIAFLFVAGFSSMFFIHVDISVRAPGIIRPMNERTEIKSSVSGLIDSLYYKEGDPVEKNSILLTIRDPALKEKIHLNETEMALRQDFIHDLKMLTDADQISYRAISFLRNPFYKQEALRFFSKMTEHHLNLLKAEHETNMNASLAGDKVISPKEFYDIRMQQQKTIAAFETFRREQFSSWQADLIKYETELQSFLSQQKEFNMQLENDRIRAPVAGFLQQLNGHYEGNALQAGEMICSLSPAGSLLAECYVSSKDIGMLKNGQSASLLIDAFNYNYFGVVNAKVHSIDNDFFLLDKSPVFKVCCMPDRDKLRLPNGWSGSLKKGMTCQARFIINRRTLWQLLYDTMNDWLNPAG